MAALHMKEELKCVTIDSGVQCVMIVSMVMTLELFAGSWDSLHGVRMNNVIIMRCLLQCNSIISLKQERMSCPARNYTLLPPALMDEIFIL